MATRRAAALYKLAEDVQGFQTPESGVEG
jgi:hypothetical protein